MPTATDVLYYLVHPNELRAVLQWSTWHNPVHERNPEKESPELHNCFSLLDLTSRSFAAVIKELHPELLVPVCLFYLVLRGLDTIEDDMSIPVDIKTPLLRNFHLKLDEDGWKFSGCGPEEKDRELLEQFHDVITEFQKIDPKYQVIIRDITKQMGQGMADYANNAEHNVNGVDSVKDYELYCHYVAGLLGEGLTRLFVEAGLANAALLQRPELQESMGQFLQQTNIIRDVREDWDDKRKFYPKEIWSKYVTNFEDLFDPDNKTAALNCSSEMVLTALRRAPDCLYYLAGIRDQSVFNFAAIPQSMAIATLERCFRNPAIFQSNVKITRGQACQLMLDSTGNLRMVCEVFRRYARQIHKKNTPRDPNFLNISIACGQIEKFIEGIFPTQDPRVVQAGTPQAEELAKQLEKKKQEEAETRRETMYLMLAVLGSLAFISALMIGAAWFLGARFDLAIEEIKSGNILPPKPGSDRARSILSKHGGGHEEL